MLEAVYGKDKVKVNINTDLDFDAVKTNSVTYDPKNVVVSEHSIKEKNQNNAGGNNTNGSVVDNNMVNRTTKIIMVVRHLLEMKILKIMKYQNPAG